MVALIATSCKLYYLIGVNYMSQLKQKPGFSLVEILVSTTLFVVIIISSINTFNLVIKSQRGAIATQNVEESLKYFLEVTSKEIRMAKRNDALCPLPASSIFKNDLSRLSFRNYHDQCVEYKLVDDNGVFRFAITRDGVTGFVTPAKINVDELSFVTTSSQQPKVTMVIVAHYVGREIEKSTMRIQTTLSSRYYKVD